MGRLHTMTLSRDRSPLFLLTWTLMHPIDAHSPLHGLTPQDLAARKADILISFSGIDETLERPIYAHHCYAFTDVLVGQGFVDMMQEEGECKSFDFANFNQTYACPSTEPS